MATEYRLAFERPIYELESRVEKLERLAQTDPNIREELQQKRLELVELKKQIYANLKPWEVVEVARHPDRPKTSDYLQLTFDEFVELHGDRCFGDDRAIRTGWAKLDMFKVMVIGHEKGKTTKERLACNYGCAHPEGYRKAMAKAKLAAKFHLPIICLIDTPGAYPGIGAEERGQAQVIAESMFLMSQLPTPIICVVIGEGGSGGALAIGVGDRIAMLEHAYYSVISPEGCAGILWKDRQYKEEAARALKMTSKDLIQLGTGGSCHPGTAGRCASRSISDGIAIEIVSPQYAQRTDGDSHHGACRSPVSEVSTHGGLSREPGSGGGRDESVAEWLRPEVTSLREFVSWRRKAVIPGHCNVR
jgi:acetyl-CoA carboxylase carboxyl transferase subunit alpha